MIVKKQHLELFFTVLRGTDGVVSLKDARIRDAFMKPLATQVDQMVKDRSAIYESYCRKTEDGEPDTKDGQYHFDADDLEKANKELQEFGEETIEAEYPWGVTAEKLKELMEASHYKPRYGEAEIIDELIKSL